MINHIRTLLLNESGGLGYPIDYPGEEYVPADYAPVALPAALDGVHAALFGRKDADRAFKNLRLRQITTLLHAEPTLKEYVSYFDSRVTYFPDIKKDLFNYLLKGPVITLVSRNYDVVLGDVTTKATSNRIFHTWQCKVNSGSSVAVTYSDGSGNTVTGVYTYTVGASGLSDPLQLPETTIKQAFSPVTGFEWKVDLLMQPVLSLSELIEATLEKLSATAEKQIFPAGRIEPVTSLYNLWLNHPDKKVKFGAIVLGIAHQIEALRN